MFSSEAPFVIQFSSFAQNFFASIPRAVSTPIQTCSPAILRFSLAANINSADAHDFRIELARSKNTIGEIEPANADPSGSERDAKWAVVVSANRSVISVLQAGYGHTSIAIYVSVACLSPKNHNSGDSTDEFPRGRSVVPNLDVHGEVGKTRGRE
jgi:hypothetical protein